MADKPNEEMGIQERLDCMKIVQDISLTISQEIAQLTDSMNVIGNRHRAFLHSMRFGPYLEDGQDGGPLLGDVDAVNSQLEDAAVGGPQQVEMPGPSAGTKREADHDPLHAYWKKKRSPRREGDTGQRSSDDSDSDSDDGSDNETVD